MLECLQAPELLVELETRGHSDIVVLSKLFFRPLNLLYNLGQPLCHENTQIVALDRLFRLSQHLPFKY